MLAVRSGVLDFAESAALGSNLLEFCTGTTAISEMLYPADPSAEDRKRRVDIVLVRQPAVLSTLAAIRSGLNLEMSTAQLLALARTAPQTLLAGVRIIGAEHSLASLPPEAADCLHLVNSSSDGSREGS